MVSGCLKWEASIAGIHMHETDCGMPCPLVTAPNAEGPPLCAWDLFGIMPAQPPPT